MPAKPQPRCSAPPAVHWADTSSVLANTSISTLSVTILCSCHGETVVSVRERHCSLQPSDGATQSFDVSRAEPLQRQPRHPPGPQCAGRRRASTAQQISWGTTPSRRSFQGRVAFTPGAVASMTGTFGEAARVLTGNVRARFLHDGDGSGVLAVGLDAGRVHRQPVGREPPGPPLGHLGTAGVAGAEEQQPRRRAPSAGAVRRHVGAAACGACRILRRIAVTRGGCQGMKGFPNDALGIYTHESEYMEIQTCGQRASDRGRLPERLSPALLGTAPCGSKRTEFAVRTAVSPSATRGIENARGPRRAEGSHRAAR